MGGAAWFRRAPATLDPPAATHAQIRLRAMDLLARREHLRGELAGKLRRRFGEAAAGEIDAALARLEREGLLSDRRFAEAYVRSRVDAGRGPRRIREELRRKGAALALAEQAVAACGADWLAVARRARRKKFGDEMPCDFNEKARQMRFLAYRGFAGETAAAACGADQSLPP